MFRSTLQPYLALLLLLCFLRTLLPEAWVVAWHPHTHTTIEPAYAGASRASKPLLLLSTRHQHCHTEQFYTAAFLPAERLLLPQPHRVLQFRAQSPAPTRTSLQQAPHGIVPRGPPAALLARFI